MRSQLGRITTSWPSMKRPCLWLRMLPDAPTTAHVAHDSQPAGQRESAERLAVAGSSFAKGSNLLAENGRSLLNVACERVCALDQKTGSERASRTCATSGRRHAFRRRSHLAGATLALQGASVAISGETGAGAAAWIMLPRAFFFSPRRAARLEGEV